jgi:hypothetical protein
VTRVPIACTLEASDAQARVIEWKEFLESCVVEVQRTPTMARLRLRDQGESILAATDLARREKTCCGFLEFRLSLLSDAVWLEIETCLDAELSLDELSLLFAP